MTRKKIDSDKEINLMIHSIANDVFLKEISSIEDVGKYLKTSYSKTIWNWVTEYQKEFGKAPKEYIQEIYKKKILALKDEDDETKDGISMLLTNLSNKYEQFTETTNIDPLIEDAKNYLELRNKEKYKEEVEKAIASNKEIPPFKSILKNDRLIEYTGEELLNTKFRKRIPIIPNFIMLGSCILLVGAAKIGKSWMALQIAISIIMGKTLFGKKEFKVDKTRHVLYLANEDTPEIIQSRLLKLNVSAEDIKKLHTFFNWSTRGCAAVNQVKEYLKSNTLVKCVIIDCLGTVRGKANSRGVYDDDYQEIQRWRDLCHEMKITIIIIHHPRKTIAYGNTNEYDIMELTSGSNALGGAADRTMILTRNRNDDKAKLYSMGRDCEDCRLALKWEPPETGSCWVLNGNGNIEESEYTDARRAVLQYMDEDIKSTGQIATALGRKPSATTQLLEKLAKDGKIEKTEYGKWRRK